MFKRKKKKTGCETPEFKSNVPMPPVRPPKPPTSGSNAVKSNPPNTGSSVQTKQKQCPYETPCGWCTKWDKKCDKKIGCGNDQNTPKRKDSALEYIKSGKGLPPLDAYGDFGLQRINERKPKND